MDSLHEAASNLKDNRNDFRWERFIRQSAWGSRRLSASKLITMTRSSCEVSYRSKCIIRAFFKTSLNILKSDLSDFIIHQMTARQMMDHYFVEKVNDGKNEQDASSLRFIFRLILRFFKRVWSFSFSLSTRLNSILKKLRSLKELS